MVMRRHLVAVLRGLSVNNERPGLFVAIVRKGGRQVSLHVGSSQLLYISLVYHLCSRIPREDGVASRD